jgi:hypothetical protein
MCRYLEGLAPCDDPRVGVVTGIQKDAICGILWSRRQNEKVNAGYIWDLGVQNVQVVWWLDQLVAI